jgi:predicted TIM-barrel fold metal-dependent hydrolase
LPAGNSGCPCSAAPLLETLSAGPAGNFGEAAGFDRLLFGSDCPLAPEALVAAKVNDLAKLALSEAEKALISHLDATALCAPTS